MALTWLVQSKPPRINSKYTRPIHFYSTSNAKEYIMITTSDNVFKYDFNNNILSELPSYPIGFNPINHITIINKTTNKIYFCAGKDKGFIIRDISNNQWIAKNIGHDFTSNNAVNYGAPINASWFSSFCISNNKHKEMNGLHIFGFNSHFKFDLTEEIWINQSINDLIAPPNYGKTYFIESKEIILNHEFQSNIIWCYRINFDKKWKRLDEKLPVRTGSGSSIYNIFDEVVIVFINSLKCFCLNLYDFKFYEITFKFGLFGKLFISNDNYLHCIDFLGIGYGEYLHMPSSHAKISICDLIPKQLYMLQKDICNKILTGYIRVEIQRKTKLFSNVSMDIANMICIFYTMFA
eukprot:159120_1